MVRSNIFPSYCHEQRGAGCEEHLSPQKVARKHKKANESKLAITQLLMRIFDFSDSCQNDP